jgi:hypothetical protein
VDLGIVTDDVEAVMSLEAEVERAGHELRIVDPGGWLEVRLSPSNGNHVDIWVWEERNGILSPAWSEGLETKDWPGMTGRYDFPVSFIERLEPVVLEGLELPAPAPVERFIIDHRYGPGFRTPLRPVLDKTRYPDIRREELTDLHVELFQAVAEKESELLAQERHSAGGRLAGVYVWERWIWSGRPRRPAQAHVEALRRELVGDGQSDPLADELLESLASLEQGLQEEASLSLRTRVYRLGRRARRLAQRARRVAARSSVG